MNTIGIALVWCAVQVTLMGLPASVLYVVVRRLRPAAGPPMVLAGLMMVAILSLLALSPWPRWAIHRWRQSPAELMDASLPSPGDPAQKVFHNSPLPPAGEGQGVKAVGIDTVSSRAKPSSLTLFWEALVEELSRPQEVAPAGARRWPAAVAALMLAAMACGLGWLLLGVAGVRRQRLRGRLVFDGELSELVDALRSELGCRRPIEVRQCDDLVTAATIGWLRPVLLLPADWTTWTPPQRRAILAHEIAHARSHDFLALLCGQLALALQFYHPLVHWLVKRLRLEQELAADAAAAGVSGGQQKYLTTIAEVALRQQDRPLLWPARMFLPTQTTFLRRIAMLRDSKVRSDRLSPAARALAVGTVVLCGLMVAGLRGPAWQPQASAADAAKTVPEKSSAAATKGAADAIDLSFVPPTATVFVVLRPAAAFARPELAPWAKVLEESGELVPKGSRLADLRQITVIAEAIPFGRRQVVVFQSIKPLAAEPVLPLIGGRQANLTVKDYEGKKMYVGEHVAELQYDDRTVIVALPEKAMGDYMAGQRGVLPPWLPEKVWEQFQSDHLVAAGDMTIVGQDMNAFMLHGPPDGRVILAPISPLWEDSTCAIGGVRLGDEVRIHALAVAKDQSGAARLEKTAGALQVLALNAVKTAQAASKQGFPMSPEVALLQDVAEPLLTALRIDREGTIVRVQSSTNMAEVQKTLPAVAAARQAARRAQSLNNLKQLALAMMNYLDANRHFPPAVLYGPDGKTPYSWRVALLPWLDQKALYDQYHFDEPWDGPNNRKLLEKMPAVFRCPTEPAESKNACYFALVGPGTIFDGQKGTTPGEIVDGMSNTLLLVEAKRDIPWTKPEDIAYDPDKPLPELGGFFEGGFNAAFADGSVYFPSATDSEKVLRALITKADRQPVRRDDALRPQP
jgi:beta-lactamase regulating signal transducer with metallopeptidase domain